MYWFGDGGGEIPPPETTTGIDGKRYPASRPRLPEIEAKATVPMADTCPAPAEIEDLEDKTTDVPVEIVRQPEQEPVKVQHNHRALGTGESEWHTPVKYVEMAQQVMGEIDLDPATSEIVGSSARGLLQCASAAFVQGKEDGSNQ